MDYVSNGQCQNIYIGLNDNILPGEENMPFPHHEWVELLSEKCLGEKVQSLP